MNATTSNQLPHNNLIPTNNTNCLQINLRRSKKALHELRVYLSQNNDIDIVIVNEPYNARADGLFGGVSGYSTHQFPSDDPKEKPCKTVILVKNESAISILGISNYSDTNMITLLTRNNKGGKVYIVGVYIEPRNDPNHTLHKIDLLLQNTRDSTHIIAGDLNGWHTQWGSKHNNPRGNDIYDLIIKHNLNICNINGPPTFHTVTHGQYRESNIDLTLISNPKRSNVNNWEIHNNLLPSSDHHVITFSITPPTGTRTNKLKRTTTFRYNTNNIRWHRITNQLKEIITNQLDIPDQHQIIQNFTETQIDDYINKLTSAIQIACDELLPRSTYQPTKPPWWTDELETIKQKVIRNHHTLARLARLKRPINDILQEKETLTKDYQKLFHHTSTESFKEFCSSQTREDVWSVTNRIIQHKNPIRPPTTIKKTDGSHTTTIEDTATELIKRFFPDDTPNTNIEQNRIAQMMHTTNEPSHSHQGTQHTPEPLLTTTEVIHCLKTFNPKKAPGPDHLTSDICLQVTMIFPELITAILNQCFKINYFPKAWKVAIVKIIPKPGKACYEEASSYRPIGLINVFGKLLEKLIINRLNHHLHTTNNHCTDQFGFKPQTSTNHALHKALNIIRSAKTKKQHVLATSIDIKAAFDNAWWPAIFKRLKEVNCPLDIYKILLNYVKDRTIQFTLADYTITKTPTKGCIQGSVCGPTMWNLLLDLVLTKHKLPVESCHLQAYADDILLITHHENTKELEYITNNALRDIHKLCNELKLTLSPTKTQAVGFSYKVKKLSIRLDGQIIPINNSIKYLGIIIDHKLTFIKHTEYIINKVKNLYRRMAIFVRPTWGLIPANIKTIYLQVIQPIISYAAGIWAPKALSFQHVNNLLLSIQRLFAIKIIQGFKTIRTSTAIILAKLIPLPHKLAETAKNEITKLTGTSEHTPTDLPIDAPTRHSELLHPALRIGMSFTTLSNEEQYLTFSNDHPNHLQIFTDGSKLNNKVGAALIVIDPNNPLEPINIQKRYKLHDLCSVYQAEMFAIFKATEWIKQRTGHRNYAILSDSLSALTEIANPNTTNHTATNILKNLLHITTSTHTVNVLFAWVKGHADITGNMCADLLARQATTLHKTPDFNYVPYSYIKSANHKTAINHKIEFYTKISPHTLKHLPNYETFIQFTQNTHINFHTTQLLTNHAYHKSYLHRFHITNNNHCPCDNNSEQTFDHLIEKCPRFSKNRQIYLEQTRNINNPYNLEQITKKESAIEAYVILIKHIIDNLKKYNTSPSTSQTSLTHPNIQTIHPSTQTTDTPQSTHP